MTTAGGGKAQSWFGYRHMNKIPVGEWLFNGLKAKAWFTHFDHRLGRTIACSDSFPVDDRGGTPVLAIGDHVLKKILALAVTPILLLTASCDKKQAEAPTGQVVATVNGMEITLLDLRHETGSTNPSRAAEQAALQAIIARQLLADQAAKEELDRQPGTAMMQEKAKQLVLVDALTNKIRASVPQPSREEARQFVADHPSSFSQRRVFLVDQLIILGNSPDLIKAIQPLDTLAEIEQMLVKRNVAFRRSVGTIDALSIDADAAEKIAALPPATVFASPEGPIIRANAIRETVVEPVTGEEAEKVALEMLRKRRSDGMVANRVNELLAQGQKAVQYNAAYRPQKSTGETALKR